MTQPLDTAPARSADPAQADTQPLDVAQWVRDTQARVEEHAGQLDAAREARRQAFVIARAMAAYGIEGIMADLGMTRQAVQDVIDGRG